MMYITMIIIMLIAMCVGTWTTLTMDKHLSHEESESEK